MTKKVDNTSSLKRLGESTSGEYQFSSPHSEMLESFPNNFPERDYLVIHETEEFTSLCPKTKQPDFGKIRVQYIPEESCVETKSLKMYLFAYRNEGTFMETIVNQILSDLVEAISPRLMLVIGEFRVRGGITTTVEAEYSKKPETEDSQKD